MEEFFDLGVKADHSELSDKGTLIEVRPWHVLEEGLRNCAHCVIQNHVQWMAGSF